MLSCAKPLFTNKTFHVCDIPASPGAPDSLYSSYHVSYNMLLNMLRVEGADPEFLVRSSFHQYQQEQGAPALEAQADDLERERDAIKVEDEDQVADYYLVAKQIERCENEVRQLKMKAENSLPWIQAGRLVRVGDAEKDFGWSAVVDFSKVRGGSSVLGSEHTVEVLLRCLRSPPTEGRNGSATDSEGLPDPCPPDQATNAEMRVVRVSLAVIQELSTIRIHLPNDLTNSENRRSVLKTMCEVERRFKGVIPVLDPIKDMNIRGEGLELLLEKRATLEKRRNASPVHTAEDRPSRFAEYSRKAELTEKVKLLRRESKASQTPLMRDQLRRMKVQHPAQI